MIEVAYAGEFDCVQYLCDHGANVNIQNKVSDINNIMQVNVNNNNNNNDKNNCYKNIITL